MFTPAAATFTLGTLRRGGEVVRQEVRFGSASGLPVAGDWNADGVGDVGVWRPSTGRFALRVTDRGVASDAVVRRVRWGHRRG